MPAEKKTSGLVVLIGIAFVFVLSAFYVDYGKEWYDVGHLEMCAPRAWPDTLPKTDWCYEPPPPPDPNCAPHATGASSLLCGGDVGVPNEPYVAIKPWYNQDFISASIAWFIGLLRSFISSTFGFWFWFTFVRWWNSFFAVSIHRTAFGIVIVAAYLAALGAVAKSIFDWAHESMPRL